MRGQGPFPLDGIRVLDLSRVLSGPFVGRLLADLGADVVKIEPPEGDVTRIWGAVRHGQSGYFTQQNAGKRGLAVDLKAPGAADLVVRLAARADVAIENFRPGVLDALGLGWPVLSAAHPQLVLLSISGFGQQGPGRRRPAYAPVIHAETGVVDRQAELEGLRPADLNLSVADTNASLHGLVGVLAALLLRARTGTGQHVDLGMLDAMLATDDYSHFALDGQAPEHLSGNVWEATGGPVMIAGDFKWVWHRLSTVHGVADPTPEGADLETKIRFRRAAAEAWFTSFPDRAALVTALDAANLAWGDVRPHLAAFDHEVVASRGIVAQVDDRGGGTRPMVESPYRFSAAASGLRRGAPRHGEHHAEVLAEWLGMGADEVARLTEAGILCAGRS